MAGWPTRVTRTSLGPTMVNEWPVVDPTKDLDAAKLNLEKWQLAGMNLTAFRGMVVAHWTGAAMVVDYQTFAFDVEGALAPLVFTRAFAGIYTVPLPATALDETGATISIGFAYGTAAPLTIPGGVAPGFGTVEIAAGTATVILYVVGTGVTDAPFILLLV